MLKININKIDINSKNYYKNIINLINLRYKKNKIKKIENYSKNIIYNIEKFKEKSLLFYLKKFENRILKNIKNIEIDYKTLENEFFKLDNETKFILESSKNRIEMFHEEQKKNIIKNWKMLEESGNIMGQKINNIKSVGLYIPGGRAIYPSSVFMNIIPAKIAGIDNITVCSPSRSNNNLIFSSIFICGIKKIYSIGGIQAISSMFFGNKIIKKCDKVCGPGNIYITISKKILFGISGIDNLAGPSELTVIADNKSDPEVIVMDLFSQSEHDNLAQSILICDDYEFIKNIEFLIKKYIPFLYRKNIIYNSILKNIIIIKVNNLNQAFNILNMISPEHLIISINNGYEFFKNIKDSGSNFIDYKTGESFGDYNSGLNHIIPTNKNCKFSSPLGVYDFNKNLNFLKINNLSFNKISNSTIKFSKKEKLYSHSDSIKIRI
ncbi:Histidinol dehydrogenase [Candidatus Nasuia deltocephalinicola]|uniref:Histidinol dehydrogenase n=1 Tax=Candidatus Nasuia deltocephalincola TaxID=1160784 RepID=A0A7G6UHH6_9PROT|nr:Histidinol dehydrogenase [Candidatus Nasuia deltocephalinicola]